ncbi:MAG: hypothetical protein LUO93_11885 [Methanomicrobiales archaeon]|nr:hypothetical protein [Methanomicrobiales archaeon]MDD1679868.1 hypothetical protein [Methanomicrobiales archaeon]
MAPPMAWTTRKNISKGSVGERPPSKGSQREDEKSQDEKSSPPEIFRKPAKDEEKARHVTR